MNPIQIAVQAYILDLLPLNPGRRPRQRQTPQAQSQGLQLQSLANGLALPSFWTESEIRDAFAVANRIWDQAKIEFAPVNISHRSECVPPDENGMWIHLSIT
jgi:hypothetical protein